jgi:hypothetical protein
VKRSADIKVIHVAYAHLTEKVVKDVFIDHLRGEGAAVEYWDLVRLLFGGGGEANTIAADYVRAPASYEELEKMLRLPENRNAVYVIHVSYEGRFVRFFRLLSKYAGRLFFFSWGQFPCGSRSARWAKKIAGGLCDPARLCRSAWGRMRGIAYKKTGLVRPYDVVFAAGRAAAASHPDAVKVVPINTVDYDRYVETAASTQRLVEKPYAVFLDIYLPFQRNNLRLSNLPALEPINYLSSCNRFFDLVEKWFGVEVVIAAHPRSDYGPDAFAGRAIFRGVTPELVKFSEFVISHNSTAVGYAVLNRKPVVFIYTDAMRVLYKGTPTMTLIEDLSAYLGANVYNIDEVTAGDQIAIGSADPARYRSYKYEYLTTPESEHAATWEIFWSEVRGC